jgi:hypothetical protein
MLKECNAASDSKMLPKQLRPTQAIPSSTAYCQIAKFARTLNMNEKSQDTLAKH